MENNRLENVTFSYGEEVIHENLDLTLQEKKFNTLLGPSGCGKTTILRLVAGFLTPQQGKIVIGDKEITHLMPEKRNISTVFQNYALFQNMSVKQNIAYGLKIRKIPKNKIDEKCAEYLNLVRMEEYADKGIDELSGGQQQRVAIARAIAAQPPVILADEPTGNLDSSSTKEIIGILEQLHDMGRTVIIITHDDEIAQQAWRRIRIKDGRVVLDTKYEEDQQHA